MSNSLYNVSVFNKLSCSFIKILYLFFISFSSFTSLFIENKSFDILLFFSITFLYCNSKFLYLSPLVPSKIVSFLYNFNLASNCCILSLLSIFLFCNSSICDINISFLFLTIVNILLKFSFFFSNSILYF